MSAHFGCTHVSIPSVWLKWGQKEGHALKEDTADKQQTDFAESLESPDDGFTLLDDAALSKVGQKSGLVGMYDKDSQAVAEKMKGIDFCRFVFFLRFLHWLVLYTKKFV